MNVLNLSETIGDILGVAKPTAQVYGRFGRDKGLLTSRGRGRNVADATCIDAAYLTIAMMLSPRPAAAARYMLDFGSLQSVPLFAVVDEDHVDYVSPRFPHKHTFVGGLTELFTALGDPLFVESLWPVLQKDGDKIRLPRMEILIRETELKATLQFDFARFGYEHSAFSGIDVKSFHEQTEVERAEYSKHLQVAVSIGERARDLYSRPVKKSVAIDADQILEIAASVNGISFWQLLVAHAKRLGVDDDE
jgi:hypothetical protein